MNPRDLLLWTSGLALLEAGTPERLTDDMREVLVHFGGDAIMHRCERPPLATKSIGTLQTKRGDPPWTYHQLVDYVADYYRRSA